MVSQAGADHEGEGVSIVSGLEANKRMRWAGSVAIGFVVLLQEAYFFGW